MQATQHIEETYHGEFAEDADELWEKAIELLDAMKLEIVVEEEEEER